MKFKVVFLSHAEQAFGQLSKTDQQFVLNKLRALGENPFASQQLKKLRDFGNRYRLRVGRWRILLSIISGEQKIEIADIFMDKGSQDYRRRQKVF